MDSRQVIARFEAERQALAMMDHVNIARVFDGGATEAGRPYFVMELVHGVPITKYCDDNHLTPRERLELFVPVCQAIQHAHQKGIIHRDIKPSNVMVTLYDGKPVPKVIDFGVAKATEQKLTERTLFTQYGTMVGTLEYMSPEQAEMSALGVDTRSDIYSLGVLLYELLTGSTPLTHKRMKEAAYAEILRMIKEEEPPKPSTRLSDSGEALASISAKRHTEPAKLTKLVRGELDWIVMKTLEKDRNRRYETANGFAAGCAALLGRRAGAGVSAVGGLSPAEVRAEVQKGAGRRGGVCGPPGGGDRDQYRIGFLGAAGAQPRRRAEASGRGELQEGPRSGGSNADPRRRGPVVARAANGAGAPGPPSGRASVLSGISPGTRRQPRRAVGGGECLQARGADPGPARRSGRGRRSLPASRGPSGEAVGRISGRSGLPQPTGRHPQRSGHALPLHPTMACRRRRPSSKAVAILEQLERQHPTLLKNRSDLARSHVNLVNLYRQMGRLDQAETAFRKGHDAPG